MDTRISLTPEIISHSHPEKPDKLYSLELSKLFISKMCSLHSYHRLKSINLSSNYIPSLEDSYVDKLKDLKELDISCNCLTSPSGLLNHSICKLNISFNRLETLEGLSKVINTQNLQILRCEGNLIANTVPLTSMGSLKILNLSSNFIERLQGLENLQVLYK